MSRTIFQEIRLKQHDEDYEPCNESLPTGAKPGSLEKLLVIIERVERGQPLFHPGDNPVLATIAEEFEAAKYVNEQYRIRYAKRSARRG